MANPSPPLDLLPEEAVFFTSLLCGRIEERNGGNGNKVKCITLSNRIDLLGMGTDTLVVRSSYEPLLHRIHNSLLFKQDPKRKAFRTCVTGSPGIGKSVFALFLLRHFVMDAKKTVLYWYKDYLFLFSFDKEVKKHFKLNILTTSEKSLGFGKWDAALTNDWALFAHHATKFDILFLHDPVNDQDERLSNRIPSVPKLVYFLPKDHGLIRKWTQVNQRMDYFTIPSWTKIEGMECLPFLPIKDSEKADPKPQEVADQLYGKFGGCIRGWVATDPKFLPVPKASK